MCDITSQLAGRAASRTAASRRRGPAFASARISFGWAACSAATLRVVRRGRSSGSKPWVVSKPRALGEAREASLDRERLHLVVFEDAVAAPERVARALYEFLGVDPTMSPRDCATASTRPR